MHEKHVARETYLESPGRNMMEPFCKRTKDFKPSAVFAKKKKIIDMVLNMPRSYRESIWYYNTGDTRAFLAI